MESPPPMFDESSPPVSFDPTECRILGTLVEKSMATPDAYPLTLNALVAGCNQKSNRNPETAFEVFEVEGAIRALQLKRAIGTREGGRVARYTHRLDELVTSDAAFLAILAELMLRGPQTTNELKTRIQRMGITMTPDEVETALRESAHSARPCVQLNPKRAGERYPRWQQLLSTEAVREAEPAAAALSDAPAAASTVAPPTATSTPMTATPATSAPTAGGDLLARLAKLEARVEALEKRLESSSGEDDRWHDID